MWLRFKFSIFGREIWSLEVDEDGGELLEDAEYEEEEEEDEEDEEEHLRWGEPATFVRDVFVSE